jgi:hypothetical protein
VRVKLWVAIVAASAAAPAAAQSHTMCAAEREAMAASAGLDVDRAVRAMGGKQADPAARAREEAAYRENLRIRRHQAEQYAAAARAGAPLPADAAASLRRELAADIEQWRVEFHVERNEAKAMRRTWLVDRDSLTAPQWAQRRLDWWAARDAWVAAHSR